jgi:hypothetical protein
MPYMAKTHDLAAQILMARDKAQLKAISSIKKRERDSTVDDHPLRCRTDEAARIAVDGMVRDLGRVAVAESNRFASHADVQWNTRSSRGGQTAAIDHWLLVLELGVHITVVDPAVVLPAPSRAVPVPRLTMW